MLTCTIIGNLGCNAETCAGGNIRLRIAHTTRRSDGSENTMWITAFLPSSKSPVQPYLTQGTKVYVTGSLSFHTYIDNLGLTQVCPTINAHFIEICSHKQPTTAG